MHHPQSKLLLVAALAAASASVLVGCFKPDLPVAITCALDGTCPPGLRCETSANICVDPSQAAVSELHFTQQPASVEAGVDAPAIAVELRDASGRTVPVTGGTFAVELEANETGVNLLGPVIHAASQGVVTFDKLRFDRPARGLRLVVHGGDLSATSAPFDVLTTRPAVLGISVGGIVDRCATVTYQLQQLQSLPVDVLVEFDPDGPEGPLPFRRATQAASAPGKAGVDGVPGSPDGRALTFTWDTTADVGAFDVTGRLRITPSVDGVPGRAFEQQVTVRNGARFFAFVHGVPEGIRHLVDDNHDGQFTYSAVNVRNKNIQFETMDSFPVPEGASVKDYAIGDFDGDARFDLVVGLSTGTVVKNQLRSGGGRMGPDEPMATRFTKLVTEDLDRDGLDDVIGVEADSGDVVILRSSRQAPGALVEAVRPWRGGDTASVKLADLDHDGWKDLVVARTSATSPVVVVRGSAAGLGEATVLAGLTGSVVAVADLDLDGRDDVASLDAAGLHVAASSAGRVDLAAITGTALGLHDVNGDRLPDVVVANGDSIFLHAHAPARHLVAFVPAARVGAAPETTEIIIQRDRTQDRADIIALANGGPEPPGTVVRFANATPRRCTPRLGAPLVTGPSMMFGSALGDVNVDGKVDRVSFGRGSDGHGRLVAAFGRGDGTFEAAAEPLYEWAALVQQRSLVITDLDGDSRNDMAFLNGDEGVLTVLYNDRGSPGTFAPINMPIEVAEGLAVADLDGDGAQDLVILDAGRVNIRRGDPSGQRSFSAPTVLRTPFDSGDANTFCREGCEAYVVDLDADGRLDILVRALGALYLYRADPDAPDGYDTPVITPFNNGTMGISDITDDGRPKILIRYEPSATAPAVLSGLSLNSAGTGFETVWSIPAGSAHSATVDIDVDGDGIRETILEAGDRFWQLIHGPKPEVRELPWGHFSRLGDRFAVIDVSADGYEDLVANTAGGTFVIRFDSNGPRDLPTLLTPRGKGENGGFGNQVAIGDFSGDDLPDLAVRASADGEIILTRQASDAPGTLVPDEVAVAGLYSCALADVDGDRRDDLVTYGMDASLFYLDPAAPMSHGQCVSAFPSYPYAVGDVDRDGSPDIVEATWTDVVLRRDPADACGEPVPVMALDAFPGSSWLPRALKLADMNQDGFLDIVIATDAVRIALQDPDAPGTFSVTDYEPHVRSDYAPYYDFEVADVNSDSHIDVVVIDVGYDVRLFAGTFGTPGRLEPSIVLAENVPGYTRSSISVGDVNDDGRPDVVVGGGRRTEVFLQSAGSGLPNQGGSFELGYVLPSAGVSQCDGECATVDDFDRDGRNDVIYVDPALGTMLLKGR